MYRDGTVSIDNNSHVVTGTGTKWVSVAGAQAGWEITFDGITFYHVSDVISDTELHIESILEGAAYEGEALNGANYALRALPNSVGQLGNAVSRINDTVRTTQLREEAITGWAVATSATFSFTDYTGQQFEFITPHRVTELSQVAQSASNTITSVENRVEQVESGLLLLEPSLNQFNNERFPLTEQRFSEISALHTDFTVNYGNWIDNILPNSQQLHDDTVANATIASNAKNDSANSASKALINEQNSAQSASAAQASASAASISEQNSAQAASVAVASANSAQSSENNVTLLQAQTSEDAATSGMLRTILEQIAIDVEQDKLAAQNSANEAMQAAQSLTGGLFFGGPWDASSGSAPPTPSDGSAYYKITAAGVIESIDYAVNDNIVYDNINQNWFKVDNTESVVSVAGKQGVVTLDISDIEGLSSALSQKAESVHSHSIEQVQNLSAALASKASATHSHDFSEFVGAASVEQGGTGRNNGTVPFADDAGLLNGETLGDVKSGRTIYSKLVDSSDVITLQTVDYDAHYHVDVVRAIGCEIVIDTVLLTPNSTIAISNILPVSTLSISSNSTIVDPNGGEHESVEWSNAGVALLTFHDYPNIQLVAR